MAKLKIKPVNHGTTKADVNRYCGAAVVSAITGMTTGEAARLVRHLSGVRSVKGTTIRQIRDAFNACGVQFNRFEPVKFGMRFNRTNGVTLTGWLRGTVKYRNAERVFLVVAGQHWQLVQGRRYVCGLTKEIVSIKDKKVKRRARVSYVYELTAPDGITIPHVAKKPKNPNSGATASKARRLAKELGVEIEIDCNHDNERSYWLGGYKDAVDYAEIGVIEQHTAYSWSEVVDTLQAIKDYKSQAIAA
jgi:hypothetical protein